MIVWALDTKAYQFKKTGVENFTLINHKTAAVDLQVSVIVWVVVLSDSDVISCDVTFSSNGPGINVTRPIVGSFEIMFGCGFVAVQLCDFGRTDETGNLRRDG